MTRALGAVLGLSVFGSVSAHAACATTVRGVDVSKYDGIVDWATVQTSGVSFAMARISDGMSADATFATNWSGMRQAGLLRAAYQFFEPADDPTAQAMLAAAAIGTLGPGDLPIVLDVEVTGGQSMATIVANISTWLSAAEIATGKRPIIYAGASFWNSNVDAMFPGYALWVANYCSDCCPTLPTDFSDWQFWQYSATGQVAGIDDAVDLDTFNGTLATLNALAGVTMDMAEPVVDAAEAADLALPIWQAWLFVTQPRVWSMPPCRARWPATGCSYADH